MDNQDLGSSISLSKSSSWREIAWEIIGMCFVVRKAVSRSWFSPVAWEVGPSTVCPSSRTDICCAWSYCERLSCKTFEFIVLMLKVQVLQSALEHWARCMTSDIVSSDRNTLLISSTGSSLRNMIVKVLAMIDFARIIHEHRKKGAEQVRVAATVWTTVPWHQAWLQTK